MVRVVTRELPSRGEAQRLAADLAAKEVVVQRQADQISWLRRENARLCRLVADNG